MTKKVYKTFSFELTKTKQLDDKGTFDGFASTPAIDRDGDKVLPEAFISSLKEQQERGKQYIKLLFNHNRDMPIGGIPLENVKVTDQGLFFKDAFLDLNVQKAKELHSLMKNNIINELSIGFLIRDSEWEDDTFVVKELELLEVSVVTEPANQEAIIMNVKQLQKEATLFRDLPVADRDRPWDGDEAIARVREFTNSEESPTRDYKNAFLYYDKAKQDNFTAYKLPFADVIDGKLTAVPRGLFAAVQALQGARGGVDFLTDLERDLVERHINRYYEKMDMQSPFEDDKTEDENDDNDEKSLINIPSLKTERELEKCLRIYGFSRKKAIQMISVMKSILVEKEAHESQSDFDLKEALPAVIQGINNNLDAISNYIKLGDK